MENGDALRQIDLITIIVKQSITESELTLRGGISLAH